jgi:hypothetical protein
VHCVAATPANEVTPPPEPWELKHEAPPANQPQPLCPAGSVPTPASPANGSASPTNATPPITASPTKPAEKPPTPGSTSEETEPFGGVSPLIEKTGYPTAPYYYAGDGYHTPETQLWYGLSAGIVVGAPKISSAAETHSLDQISVGTPSVEYTSEMGWHRDEAYGTGSRLFIFINNDKYKKGGDDCYNCVTALVGATYTQNEELTVGHDYQFATAYYDERWWYAIGPNWIAYEPESFWGGKFTSSTWLSMYGEVYDTTGPNSQMGNGTIGTKTGSLVMGNPYLYYKNDEKLLTTAGHAEPEKNPYPSDLPGYSVGLYSANAREWHYGGE